MASYKELPERVAQKISPDLASGGGGGGGYSIDVVIAEALVQLPAGIDLRQTIPQHRLTSRHHRRFSP
jgi:hypothetical protein